MEILRKCGLETALSGFVPPAWLLSPAARKVVHAAGFRYVEYFSGIDIGSATLARKVVGLGSLSALEAVATAGYASLAARWTTADTRLAIHPADMRRPFSVRAMARLLAHLRGKLRPQSYVDFISAHAAAMAIPDKRSESARI
jgi:predicted deacetylase